MKRCVVLLWAALVMGCATAPKEPESDTTIRCFIGSDDLYPKQDLLFLSNSLEMEPQSLRYFDEFAKTLKLNAYRITAIHIEGHTDDTGSLEGNLHLGFRRAAVVYRFLLERGISGDLLKVQSYGEELPIAPGTTTEARSKNRRVHFVVDFR